MHSYRGNKNLFILTYFIQYLALAVVPEEEEALWKCKIKKNEASSRESTKETSLR